MKNILAAIAAIAAITASADYIYWMVGEDVDSTYDWATAKLVQSNADPSTIGTLNYASASTLRDMDAYAYSALSGDAATYNAATYFIELYNSNGDFLAKSELGTGSSLASYIFGDNSMSPIAGSGLMPAASTYNVPEPTSGLLFLVGGMLLGLKRRRQV